MKMTPTNVFSQLLILISLLAFTKAGEKFEFGIFENYVANEFIFQNELAVIGRLRRVRDQLQAVRNAIHNNIEASKNHMGDDVQHPIGAMRLLSKTFRATRDLDAAFETQASTQFQDMEMVNQNFFVNGTTNEPLVIINGALEGLLELQATYNLDMVDFSNGYYKSLSKNYNIKGVPFEGRAKLEVDDLLGLASLADRRRLYDTTLAMIRAAEIRFKTTALLDGSTLHSGKVAEAIKSFKHQTLTLHNKLLSRKRERVGDEFQVNPYIVDDQTLLKKKKQPKFIKNILMDPIIDNRSNDFKRLELFRRTCREDQVGIVVQGERHLHKCHFLHHGDPYLKLGPFKFEFLLFTPMRSIFHDILDEDEIEYLVEISRPNLSASRIVPESNKWATKADIKYGKKGKTVAKTNQVWWSDVIYKPENYTMISSNPFEYRLDTVTDNSYVVSDKVLRKLSDKIERATNMNITARFSSSEYQVTNYGLSGLCEIHMDPYGYIEGIELVPDRMNLVGKGDILATFMAWLNDVKAGGGTGYSSPGFEDTVIPERGSAAFWVSLTSGSYRDNRSLHGGCPIISGSKWILNKWVYSFSNWDRVPCSTKNEFEPIPVFPKTAFA